MRFDVHLLSPIAGKTSSSLSHTSLSFTRFKATQLILHPNFIMHTTYHIHNIPLRFSCDLRSNRLLNVFDLNACYQSYVTSNMQFLKRMDVYCIGLLSYELLILNSTSQMYVHEKRIDCVRYIFESILYKIRLPFIIILSFRCPFICIFINTYMFLSNKLNNNILS